MLPAARGVPGSGGCYTSPVKYAVCFVTAELAPLAKAGGLADVAGSLTTLLHRAGHDLLTFLPLYAPLARESLSIEPVIGLSGLSATIGSNRYRYSILRGRRGGGLPDIMLVDCKRLFDRPTLYGDGPDEHHRFLLLCRAALEGCRRLGFAPDIMHCHDWHTAVLPLWLRSSCASEALFERTRSILTIHNLGYQGVIPASAAADLGLGATSALLDQPDLAQGRINLLRHGLRDADLVSTVSPTYAREICTPEQGMGLDGVLRERGDAIVGILNGADYDVWSPERDVLLPHRFSPADLAGKRAMRAALCARLGLDHDPRRLLVGIVSRLAWQKGFDLLFDVLPAELSAGRLSLAVLGAGEPEYERFFEGIARAHPERAFVQPGLRRRTRALDRGRLRRVPDALALRALRAQPALQPALRHRADRAPHRRARGLGRAFRSRAAAAAPESCSMTPTRRPCAGRSILRSTGTGSPSCGRGSSRTACARTSPGRCSSSAIWNSTRRR